MKHVIGELSLDRLNHVSGGKGGSGHLDSLSEIGTEQQLRLQMYMDAYSKTLGMLSNMLKKISDTAGSITQNMK